MGTVGFSLSHQSRYALHLLNGILGEGMSSRLYQSVREKHGLAYSVYSFASMLTDTGTVVSMQERTTQMSIMPSASFRRKSISW